MNTTFVRSIQKTPYEIVFRQKANGVYHLTKKSGIIHLEDVEDIVEGAHEVYLNDEPPSKKKCLNTNQVPQTAQSTFHHADQEDTDDDTISNNEADSCVVDFSYISGKNESKENDIMEVGVKVSFLYLQFVIMIKS